MNNLCIRRDLQVGESRERFQATPKREISLVRGGKAAYLWIGNAEKPMFCYGTLSGASDLRKLAKAILREIERG